MENIKIGGSLVRNARFSASTCLSRVAGCPVVSPCLWGKLENLTFLNVPKQVVIHFTLYTLHSSLHTPHFTLHTPLHSSLHTPHFTLHTFHFTILTLHSALHTPHFPLHTPHSTLYTRGWWSRDSCGASCHVLLTWLREISAVLSFKILINLHRCRCPKRSIERVSSVLQVAVVFIRLLGAAATHCPVSSRQTSSQACILCGCLFSMLFIVYVELEAWDLQHSRALIVCGHVNEGRVYLSLSLL